MNKLLRIISFEYKNIAFKKAFIITTLIMSIIVLGISFAPRISKAIEKANKNSNTEETTKVGYVIEKDIDEKILKQIPRFMNSKKYDSLDQMKKDIKKEKIEIGYNFKSSEELEVISLTNSSGKFFGSVHDIGTYSNELGEYNKIKYLIEKNVDPAKLAEIEYKNYKLKEASLEKDASKFFALGYVVIMVLYFLIIQYGIITATNIAREKNDRTMELLITSTSSAKLLIGKTIASVLVAMTGLLAYILSALIGYIINKSTLSGIFEMIFKTALTPKFIIVLILFSLIGGFMYFILYAMCGSLVNKVEDVNSSIGVPQMIVVITFMLAMSGLTAPNTGIIKLTSFIPITSPFIMIMRVSVSEVSNMDILLSASILLITTILISKLSIRVYRNTTLNYGNKLNIVKEIKKVFRRTKA